MKKYNVFHYVTFHIKKENVEANGPFDAVLKSMDAAWETAQSIGSEWGDVGFAEEQTFALVDEVGDDQFLNSVTYTQEEIYSQEENHNVSRT